MAVVEVELNSPEPKAPQQLTLAETLVQIAAERPDARAMSCFGQHWTYAELEEQVRAAVSVLEDAGIAFGDRIILQQQNGPQFLILALAAWWLGAVIVPVSPMYTAAEISGVARDSGARAWCMTPHVWEKQGDRAVIDGDIEVLISARTADFVEQVPARVAPGEDGAVPERVLVLKAEMAHHLAASSSVREPVPSASDTAIMAYTSGSTGRPKGVILSHANLLTVGHAYTLASGVANAAEVLLATAPLVHITGLSLHIGAWLASGCQLVLTERFDPETQLQAIQEERVTWTTGTATAYLSMMKIADVDSYDLSSWRYGGCGGAPIPPNFSDEFQEVLGAQLGPGYGLTESTSAVTTTAVGATPRVDEQTGVVSVGTPLAGMRVRIVDEAGAEVPAREEGRIQIYGGGVGHGYWGDEVGTRETFLESGWLHTSDVGFLDEDGWLYIVGRKSQMIIASGYKVWPRQVEDVLYAHPAVREAAVVGAPDPYRGETVVAFVSLKHDVTEDELKAHCRASLAAYKVPKSIRISPELPKNNNGKINTLQLKDEVARA